MAKPYWILLVSWLYCLCLLNQKAAETSLLTSGMLIFPYHNGKNNYTVGCDGLWQCAEDLCIVGKTYLGQLPQIKVDPIDADASNDTLCYSQGLSWLWSLPFISIKISIVMLSLALLFYIMLIGGEWTKPLYVLCCFCLTLAYAGYFDFLLQYKGDVGDISPGFVWGNQLLLSFILVFILWWNYLVEDI